nr:reverse transcriptase domain-containing protein [Tanacetum cinerariifolium]
MANRTNTTTGKDWRRRTLRFGLDEFHGGKVIISVQQNYWKTRSQENATSSVNSSRMLKLPVEKGVITLKSSRLVPLECALVSRPEKTLLTTKPILEERVNVSINPEYLKQAGKEKRASSRQKPGNTKRSWETYGEMNHKGNFKDLNKAYLKDGYPLPEIDWKVESLYGFPFKCFLDAYKGHHQIQMAKEDEEKTTFITNQGIFCYTKMPFGLRNAGATYQRLVDKAFHKQIGRNLEVYVEDLVIKKEGMFLGYKVSTKGLKVCPDKVDVVLSLPSLKCLKDAQKLNEKLASLNRSGRGVQVNEIANGRASYANCTNGKGGTYHLFSGNQRNDGSGAGLIPKNPKGMEFTYALRFRFDATNNEAEYEALIVRLKIAEQMGVKISPGKCRLTIGDQPSKQNICRKRSQHDPIPGKALRIGYYWPTMHKDARTLIRACQDYQVHKPVPRNPQQQLIPITSPWPFYKWGIDIARPFPEGPGKVKFLIVAIEYLTKCIEANPERSSRIVENSSRTIIQRLVRETMYSPTFSSVKHPQTNGLVERENRSLGEGIKARLDAGSKNWMEELSHVLWAHRTMIKSSNGDTSFSLTYETEAVILTEIGMPTLRTAEVDLV